MQCININVSTSTYQCIHRQRSGELLSTWDGLEASQCVRLEGAGKSAGSLSAASRRPPSSGRRFSGEGVSVTAATVEPGAVVLASKAREGSVASARAASQCARLEDAGQSAGNLAAAAGAIVSARKLANATRKPANACTEARADANSRGEARADANSREEKAGSRRTTAQHPVRHMCMHASHACECVCNTHTHTRTHTHAHTHTHAA